MSTRALLIDGEIPVPAEAPQKPKPKSRLPSYVAPGEREWAETPSNHVDAARLARAREWLEWARIEWVSANDPVVPQYVQAIEQTAEDLRNNNARAPGPPPRVVSSLAAELAVEQGLDIMEESIMAHQPFELRAGIRQYLKDHGYERLGQRWAPRKNRP